MKEKYWSIEGFDSTERIFHVTVPAASYSEKQIQLLLQMLAAKDGLTYQEIVGAVARRGTKIANDLLEVHHEKPYPQYSCGENPYFHARVIVGQDEGA